MNDKLGHLIGTKDEAIQMLPDLSKPAPEPRLSRRKFTEMEKQGLIEEDGLATNKGKLNLSGTHYESYDPNEIAMFILPLKGL